MILGLKMKYWLIQLQEKMIKKNLGVYLKCHYYGDKEEVKEVKGLTFLTPNKFSTTI